MNIVNDSSFTSVSILLDANQKIYMVGNTGYNFLTVKYDQLIGIHPINSDSPVSFKLYSNYPNPFNPVTKIQFGIPFKSNVNISIFDILGRQIEILLDKELSAGKYSIDFDGSKYSSGIYFYRLVSEDYIETKKMILIK